MDRENDKKSLTIRWEDAALEMLENTDRYTRNAVRTDIRNAIRDEFNGQAGGKFFLFDPERNGYATPVDDNRRTVVWYHRKDQNTADISAIIPGVRNLTRLSGDELHNYLRRAVTAESKGRILLP